MYDAHLVSILSQEEMDFLRPEFDKRGNNYWIGLQKKNGDPFARWSDGHTLNFTAWDYDRPYDSQPDECVFVTFNTINLPYSWIDDVCTNDFHYVCKKTGKLTYL